jgi:hypothetical protein
MSSFGHLSVPRLPKEGLFSNPAWLSPINKHALVGPRIASPPAMHGKIGWGPARPEHFASRLDLQLARWRAESICGNSTR